MELLTYSVTVLCVCQVGTQPYRYCFLFTDANSSFKLGVSTACAVRLKPYVAAPAPHVQSCT